MHKEIENYFKLGGKRNNKDDISKIRYIRLQKKASYIEDTRDLFYNNEDNGEHISCYALGFYDIVTCYKAKEINPESYKQHFLISYPFRKTAETLKVEQWFGIMPLSPDSGSRNDFYCKGVYNDDIKDDKEDVFFCKETLQKELPFLGIILVSLGKIYDSSSDIEEMDFKNMLYHYIDGIKEIISRYDRTENDARYIIQAYFSLNCSDLCIIVRTDTLPFIHYMNYGLNIQAGQYYYDVNTTVIFAIQHSAPVKEGRDIFLDKEALEESLMKLEGKNKDVRFIVRSNKRYNNDNSSGSVSYGVNGTGRYVTELEYADYVGFLPEMIDYKIFSGRTSNGFACSVCHEREWFKDNSDGFVNEYKPGLQKEINFCIREVKEIIKNIGELEADNFKYSYTDIYRKSFNREFRMIKDLIYTYSDLWYQNASESGFIFFAQLWISLDGIREMFKQINGKSENFLHRNAGKIIDVAHNIAYELNGYNKQFQFLNQDSVNFPSYEVQSKVNAGKYMAAYCSFLHKFFSLYYEDKGDNETIIQQFPLALVDISMGKIKANICFSFNNKTKSENHEKRSLFAVHFPSSEYFSNMWESIPLLLHEASHTQHYGETRNRNRAITYNIDCYIANFLANEMIRNVNKGIMVSSSSYLVSMLEEHIYNAITYVKGIYFDNSLEEMEEYGFKKLIRHYKDFYNCLFDININMKDISYSQLLKLKDRTSQDVEGILQVIDFKDMWYAFSKHTKSPTGIQCFANVLFLMFHHGFYEKYKVGYDNWMENEIQQKLEDVDSVEKLLLELSLFCFYNYVKKDESTRKKFNENHEHVVKELYDYLTICFTVLMWRGFENIYDKYFYMDDIKCSEDKSVFKKKFLNKLYIRVHSEDISGFTVLLKEIFNEFATTAECGISGSRNMESMLSEFYELYVSINNVFRLILEKGDELFKWNRLDYMDIFAKKLYGNIKGYIKEIGRKSGSFRAEFMRSNRSQLANLGIFERDYQGLKKICLDLLSNICSMFNHATDDIIDDRISLFEETYADCIMCCAMGLKPFGYCMFAVSAHISAGASVSDITGSVLFADRIRSVLNMYFNINLVENKEQEKSDAADFIKSIFDKDMIISICNTVSEWKDKSNTRIINNSKMGELSIKLEEDGLNSDITEMCNPEKWSSCKSKDILIKWRDEVVLLLIDELEKQGSAYKDKLDKKQIDYLSVIMMYLSNLKAVLELFIREDILSHIYIDIYDGFFYNVHDEICNNRCVKVIKKEAIITKIAGFYNMCNSSMDKKDKCAWYCETYINGFADQCNFIFDNYCDYRNAFFYLLQNIKQSGGKLEMKKWFDIIDRYYVNKYPEEV